MITLYCRNHDANCDTARDTLDHLAVAHRVIDVTGRNDPLLPCDSRLPLLVDGGQRFEGPAAVQTHLDELKGFVALRRKYQSDACYCDDEGNVE